MMLIHVWITEHLTIKVVGIAFANGFIHMLLLVGMHHEGNTDILRPAPIIVGDLAGVGSCAHGRRSHGMLTIGIDQSVGRCPTVTVVAAAARRQCVQRGRFAFAEFRVVGGGSGGH